MHELSICQSLLNQVQVIAQQHHALRVSSIVLLIGPLSGVEVELLEKAYAVASAGSVAEGADLIIQHQPVRVKCSQCGSESDAKPNNLVCKHCGDWRTTLLSGDELMLMSVNLEKSKNPAVLH